MKNLLKIAALFLGIFAGGSGGSAFPTVKLCVYGLSFVDTPKVCSLAQAWCLVKRISWAGIRNAVGNQTTGRP